MRPPSSSLCGAAAAAGAAFRVCTKCQRHLSPSSACARTVTTTTTIATCRNSRSPSWNPVRQKRFISQTPQSHQPPSTPSPASRQSQTHYSFFPETLPLGPPPKGHFPVDKRRLRSEFLRLQAKYHPDKRQASTTKAQAEALSASINEAYKTLSNPLLRAQYLLSLQGVDVANDETLKVEEPELLGLVLDAHETIESAEEAQDLEALVDENEARIGESERVLEGAFREETLERAKKEAVRLRYWVNIRQALHDWEEGKPSILQH